MVYNKVIYRKKYFQENKLKLYQKKQEKCRKLKLDLVLRLDGKCVDCGFDDLSRLESFEFDHINPENKIMAVSEFIRKYNSRNRAIIEADKCELVCSNCHRTRTYKERTIQYA